MLFVHCVAYWLDESWHVHGSFEAYSNQRRIIERSDRDGKEVLQCIHMDRNHRLFQDFHQRHPLS